MDVPSKSPILALAARTTIKEDGDSVFVDIPGGCSSLSEADRAAIFAEAQRQGLTTTYIDDALTSKLRSWTPPPLDDEEENDLSRSLESKARPELERDGCPPCYPPEYLVPLRDPPEEYKAIIQYWLSVPQTDQKVLCAQLAGWKAFRAFQKRSRHRFKDKPFDNFLDEVRERLERHNSKYVPLQRDAAKQTQLETWVEFQHYQFQRLEWLEGKRDKLTKELVLAEGGKIGANQAVHYPPRGVQALHGHLKVAIKDLERHKVFLHWVDQQRTTLTAASTAEDAIPIIDINATETIPRASSSQVVLGNARVSKSRPPKKQQRNKQVNSRRTSRLRSALGELTNTPQTSSAAAPNSRLADSLPSIRVAPSQQRGHHLLGTPPDSADKRKRARTKPERPQARPNDPSEHTRTRSGRISKPPQRWTPK